MNSKLTPREWEQISAYLDQELPPAERARFEEKLRSSPDLQHGLQVMRLTRDTLRSAPRRKVPHHFTLTAEMAARRRPSLSLFPAFSFASALSLALLILSLFVSPQSTAMPKLAAAPAAQMLEMAAATQAPTAALETPGIILWNPVVGMGGGGGPPVPAEGFGGGPPLPAAPMEGIGGGQQFTAAPAAPMTAPELKPSGDTGAPAAAADLAMSTATPYGLPEPAATAEAFSTPAEPQAERVMATPEAVEKGSPAPPPSAALPTQAGLAITDNNNPILGLPAEHEEGKMAFTPVAAQPGEAAEPSSAASAVQVIRIVLVALFAMFAAGALVSKFRKRA